MKKIFSISICIVILTFVVSMAYAQMGGSKSGGMMGGQGSQGHMEGMVLHGHEVTGGIMHQMGQMSRLMQQMREMMAKKSDAESMSKMSGIMLNMSEHIMKMSIVMKKGSASEKEMQEMDEHNLKMQKSYDMMRW